MEELLSLKWNNHQSTFIHVLGILREKQLYTDTTLACAGKFYSVHKLVLSTCSDYFSDMLDRTNCKNPVIVLKDINSEHLEALLDYMYLGEVNVRQSDLAALIKAAECLHIKGLAVPDDDPLPRNNKCISNQIRKTDANGSPPAKRKRSSDGTKIDSRPVRYDMPISLSDSTSKPESPAELSSTPVSPLQNTNTPSSSNDTHHLLSRTTLKASHAANQDDDRSGDYQSEPVVKVEVDDYSGNDVEALGIDKTENFKEEIEDGISPEEGAANKLPLDISSELPEFLQQVSSGSMQCSSFDQSSHSSPNFEPNNVQCWKGDGSNIGFPYQNFLASEESGLQTSSAGLVCKTEVPASQNEQSRTQTSSTSSLQMIKGSTNVSTPSSYEYAGKGHSLLGGSGNNYFPSPVTSSGDSDAALFNDSVSLIAVLGRECGVAGTTLSAGSDGDATRICPYCNKRFLRSWHLQRHLRSHTGERPFSCLLCSYRATHKSNLQRHVESVHWRKGNSADPEDYTSKM